MQNLVGKSYHFEDGNAIKIIQIRDKEVDGEVQPFITYEIFQGNSLPRRLVMTLTQFTDSFGHLFGLNNEHT
jgi:hypothetical protein